MTLEEQAERWAFYDTIGKALPDLHIEIKSQHDLPGCTALTWNPFCNPFVFTFMHGMRGVPPFFTKKEEELISTTILRESRSLASEQDG